MRSRPRDPHDSWRLSDRCLPSLVRLASMGRVKGRGESRAKWQHQSWRREAVEAIQEIRQQPRASRPVERRRVTYDSVIQHMLMESSQTNSSPPPRPKETITRSIQYSRDLRAQSQRYFEENLQFPSDLIERILRTMSKNISSYDVEHLKYVLGYLYPPIHGALSSLCSLEKTFSDSLFKVFLDAQADVLVIGGSVSETGFLSAVKSESRLLSLYSSFDSWEEVDVDFHEVDSSSLSLKRMYLVGSKITLSSLVDALRHISALEVLVMHDIRVSWDCSLSPGGLLNQLTSRLPCLHELQLSYCDWLTIEVLTVWQSLICKSGARQLTRVKILGLAVPEEERGRVTEIQSKLAYIGILLIIFE